MPYKAFGTCPEKTVCHFALSARSLLNTGFYAILAETCEKSGTSSSASVKMTIYLNRRRSSPEGRFPASRELGFPCVTFKRLADTKICNSSEVFGGFARASQVGDRHSQFLSPQPRPLARYKTIDDFQNQSVSIPNWRIRFYSYSLLGNEELYLYC